MWWGKPGTDRTDNGFPANSAGNPCQSGGNRGQTGPTADFRQTAPEIHVSLVNPLAARYHGAVQGEADSTGTSDRQFGLLAGCLLAAAAAWPVLRGGKLRVGLLAGGVVLVLLGAVWPRVLKPVNRLWLLLGQALGRVTNPLVAGLLFLVVIAPLGLLLRRMGRLSVRLRKDSPAPSYWQETSNAAPPAERMRFQF